MAKVKISFYCIKTQKTYKVGSEYKGSRKDLAHLMVGYKEPKEDK